MAPETPSASFEKLIEELTPEGRAQAFRLALEKGLIDELP